MHKFGLYGLILTWTAYFTLHSTLASLFVKNWVAQHRPEWMPKYRLTFNALAVVTLIPIIALLSQDWPAYLQWSGGAKWFANIVSVMAISGFIWSLKYYDMAEFLGIRQYRNAVKSPEDQESFCISPFHRFVRHPWYFFGILLIWSRDLNEGQFISAVFVTAYFVLGSRLEERKLIQFHGAIYEQYMRKVPGVIPLPWKFLSRTEADRLREASSKRQRG